MLRLSQIKLAFRNEGLLVLVTCFSTDSFQIPCHFNCLMFQRRFFVHFESSGLGAITSLDSLGIPSASQKWWRDAAPAPLKGLEELPLPQLFQKFEESYHSGVL